MIDESIKNVQIVYFSGTGGVKRIAETFWQQTKDRGIKVWQTALDDSKKRNGTDETEGTLESADLVILIYAVHAFDAPMPVYSWIKQMSLQDKKKIAVISVSGGGEMWPNTGCRVECCRALEEKGFEIVYEKMMCMPSNWVVAVGDDAAMWMLNSVPEKVCQIMDSLLAGKKRRTKYKKDFIRAWVSKNEKIQCNAFAKKLKIQANCTGCGWCAKHCPACNIEMQNNRPIFKENCIMCFRCIYGCPAHAIQSKSFMVLKEGYNLSEVEKRMQNVPLLPVEKCCKGIFWKGIRDYLTEKDDY